MKYIRKTTDEWSIHSDYGYGMEFTCYAENLLNARELLKEYRENEPQFFHKIVKERKAVK